MFDKRARLRASIRAALLNTLLGAIIAGAGLYMVMHPSSCKYEEIC